MQELQIPTRAVAVEVQLDNGSCLSGFLFLTECKFEAGPREEVMAILNDERAFLPFQHQMDSSAQSVVLNKSHIMRVRVQESGAAPAGDCLATVMLADGTQISGAVVVETPEFQSRLVDKLNHAERFIPVVGEGGVDYVQGIHVLWMN